MRAVAPGPLLVDARTSPRCGFAKIVHRRRTSTSGFSLAERPESRERGFSTFIEDLACQHVEPDLIPAVVRSAHRLLSSHGIVLLEVMEARIAGRAHHRRKQEDARLRVGKCRQIGEFRRPPLRDEGVERQVRVDLAPPQCRKCRSALVFERVRQFMDGQEIEESSRAGDRADDPVSTSCSSLT
jgi:hypothetical protein